MVVIRSYRWPGLSCGAAANKLRLLKHASPLVDGLDSELCFNIEVSEELVESEHLKLGWILGSIFKPEHLSQQSHLQSSLSGNLLIEIGPRLVGLLHDRMTQCRYVRPLDSFQSGCEPQQWWEVDVLKEGKQALNKLNTELGLAFDDWDLEYYTNLFRDKLQRNPTSVECFDLAQSNSEHSRHWFFKGKMVIDGQAKPESLIDMIIKTQETSNPNNVIKFSDNSSAIEGFTVPFFRPTDPAQASPFHVSDGRTHLIFTAETHNFPTGVSPFSGATTGTGGRLRDIQAVGRGGNYIAGTAGYCVGNLLIPGYPLPWEDTNVTYPPNLAPPLQILVEASNGASDYGNKFGEPLINGFVRSLGISEASGERREWVKPIMFSGGVGTMQAQWVDKQLPEKGMQIVKLGGPVYRIGVGGGSASSVEVQGDNASELDYGAVQRGDAEMEQKLNRVIRACVELPDNPILSIHDQGAGGNGNVLKELVEPAGAVVFTRAFQLGDPTISTLELWGAEYQESNALLCCLERVQVLQRIALRERCPMCVVGTVTGSGKMILSEDQPGSEKYTSGQAEADKRHPFDLELDLVLGKMPQKVYTLDRKPIIVRSLTLPSSFTVMGALERVLRLPSVASKRYLTNKVDRCVTGLIAQQQCVGPLHTPLADVAVTAVSLFGLEGVAIAIGEQPIKGLLDPAAGARMAVAEAITNLVFARISCLRDVKCSGNWMWPAKLPGEGAALYEACTAMCNAMSQLGIAVDGGKDSLSMAARVGQDTVKAPGSIVISAYAPCPDIRQVVTPDLKSPSQGRDGVLLLVDLSGGKCRLGGSALGQCYQQLGDIPPDMDDAALLVRAFNVTQGLVAQRLVLAGHDVSDGGLVVCLLEMAFAGISGLEIDITHNTESPVEVLFSEELGWVLEVSEENSEQVINTFKDQQVPCWQLGTSKGYGMSSVVQICMAGKHILDSNVGTLFRLWEETSFQLELLQTNLSCARSEFQGLALRKAPQYRLTFDPEKVITPQSAPPQPPRVAVIREEGSNGDREMAGALFRAGFQVWDVTMQDLIMGQVTMDSFRGVVFPGGFSYADVLGSAKGWAASLNFHEKLQTQFQTFVQREDTFSLGVCNGCQLMALLGWVGVNPPSQSGTSSDIVLDHNLSERFECRWSAVRIQKSPAIMLKGMEGSVLGVWVAHGEGRFTFREPSILQSLETSDCCAVKYVDDDRKPTEQYPFNPNGSPGGLAGVCSKDGRHLAMMPHPERCTLMWQWPWKPSDWSSRHLSPWQRIFHNAYIWCCENPPKCNR